ncbi:MAG TPA: membrane protein insertion efficiency factor YidD [Vitreimonas sp.]|nr:membrane protein insertion efficiency factor YidD [Vitreimonas sp.]
MPSPSLPALGLLGLIQLYKWTLSPLIGRGCRYQPTCSSYAADAIRMHGAWAGSWMAGARICRCAPWGGHGWDPAPETVRRNSWWRPWRYGDWKGGYREPPSSSPASGGGAERSEAEGHVGDNAPLSLAALDSSPHAGSIRKTD